MLIPLLAYCLILVRTGTNITDLHGLEILSHHYCWMRWEPSSMFMCLEFCLYKNFSLLVQFCNLQPWRTYQGSKVAYWSVLWCCSLQDICIASSVASLWSMQNRSFLVHLRLIFGEKWNSPPQRKLGAEVVKYMSWFGLKKRLNIRFWPKNPSQFRWSIFFFLEITWFWAEKTFEFPTFLTNSVSIFGQTMWFWFKNNENSGQGHLQFSHSFKKAPPPFFKSWLCACV